MRGRLISAFMSASCLSASAQTVPPFDPSSVPTIANWNAYFAAKQDLITAWLTFATPFPLPGPYSAAGTPVPTCNAGSAGQILWSNDITTMTYNATYVSDGSLIGPLFCNGTNWTAH